MTISAPLHCAINRNPNVLLRRTESVPEWGASCGEIGGGRAGILRWVRMLTIAFVSKMAATIFISPPHSLQVVVSIRKTLAKISAHFMWGRLGIGRFSTVAFLWLLWLWYNL